MENEKPKNTLRKASYHHPLRIAVLLTLIAIITVIIYFNMPHPSVTAYCKIYSQEESKVTKNTNPKDLSKIYGNLEHVAPAEVKYDTTALREIYQKIDSDPSQAFSASLSGLSAEQNIKDWVTHNCSK